DEHAFAPPRLAQALRNVFAALQIAGKLLQFGTKNVARRHDADRHPILDDRNMTEPALVHHVQRVPKWLVLSNGLRIPCHHFAKYGGLRVTPLREYPKKCIAFGKNSGKPTLHNYHDRADLALLHQARRFSDGAGHLNGDNPLILDECFNHSMRHGGSPKVRYREPAYIRCKVCVYST